TRQFAGEHPHREEVWDSSETSREGALARTAAAKPRGRPTRVVIPNALILGYSRAWSKLGAVFQGRHLSDE
ncbi:MAG: hypothetical protein ACRD2A_19240, partial [Vicinamibacterales bacterium]